MYFERSAHFTIDFFPAEFRNLNIYFPKKYHIANYFTYPYVTYIISYDENTFTINGRIDMNIPYSLEINGFANYNTPQLKVPLQIQIYYSKPELGYQIKGLKEYQNDLQTSINRAKILLGDNWYDDMAFGIGVIYYWVKIFYTTESNKYKDLYKIFNNSNK